MRPPAHLGAYLGLEHDEAYPDAGRIEGRIIELGDPVPGDVSA